MAQKRMFDVDVINQGSFFDLPLESIALYFLLGMEADDEGFVNPKKVMRLYGGSEDSLRLLILKQFIIPFETGVIVITDWKRNNYLDKNKIKPTIYQKEKEQIMYNNFSQKYQVITEVKPKLNESLTEVNAVENRREENSIEEYRVDDVENKDNLSYKEKQKLASPTTTEENLLEFVEKIFGRPLGGIEIEIISSWEDNEVTRYAIKQAELARVFRVRYIQRILQSYEKENIKSVAEAEEREKRYQESKTMKNKQKETNEEYIARRKREIEEGENEQK